MKKNSQRASSLTTKSNTFKILLKRWATYTIGYLGIHKEGVHRETGPENDGEMVVKSCRWWWKRIWTLSVCQAGSDKDPSGYESDNWSTGKDEIPDILHPKEPHEPSWWIEGVIDEFGQTVGVQHHDGLSRYQKMIQPWTFSAIHLHNIYYFII